MPRLVLGLLACLVGLGACGAVEPGSVAPGGIPDPTTVARTGRPNDWLICPAGACRAEADAEAPRFAVPPERLLAAWREVLADQPRATLIAADEQRRLLMAQDRTPLLRFVDTITVRVLPIPDGGSTFAVYSRSEIGYGDLGTNRKRLQAWVVALERQVSGTRA